MSRYKRTEPRVRLNLDFPETVRDRLERLRQDSEADSLKEVVRKAIALYERAIQTSNKGGQIILREEDGSETHLMML